MPAILVAGEVGGEFPAKRPPRMLRLWAGVFVFGGSADDFHEAGELAVGPLNVNLPVDAADHARRGSDEPLPETPRGQSVGVRGDSPDDGVIRVVARQQSPDVSPTGEPSTAETSSPSMVNRASNSATPVETGVVMMVIPFGLCCVCRHANFNAPRGVVATLTDPIYCHFSITRGGRASAASPHRVRTS
jgi:hypothetical protein